MKQAVWCIISKYGDRMLRILFAIALLLLLGIGVGLYEIHELIN